MKGLFKQFRGKKELAVPGAESKGSPFIIANKIAKDKIQYKVGDVDGNESQQTM